MTGWFNWLRLRILAADLAVYRWRVQRELKRRAKKARDVDYSSIWFVVLALGLASCAHRASLREIETVRASCVRMIESAPPQSVVAVEHDCIERLRSIP